MNFGLDRPSVDPNGGKIIAFEGTTHANSDPFRNYTCLVGSFVESCPITHYGLNATGVYTWNAGTVHRLSGPAQLCATPDGCTTQDINPQISSSGFIYFDLNSYSGRLQQHDFVASTRIYRMNVDGSARADYGTACNDTIFLDQGDPNWSNPAQIAFNGCEDSSFFGELMLGSGGSSGTIVGKSALSSGWFESVAFSPDGSSIAAYDNSFTSGPIDNQAGLYLFSPHGTGAPIRKLLASPTDNSDPSFPGPVRFSSPHFVGPNTIVFSSGGNLYTIPASCNNCSFPGNAHALTTDGQSSAPVWTSATLPTSNPNPTPTPKRVTHCVVPKLTGLTVSGATSALHAAHCQLGKQTKAYSSHVKKGRVVSQSKRRGTTLTAGAHVDITVSKGKKPRHRRHH